MSAVVRLTRREFLRVGGGATAALALGVHLPRRASAGEAGTFAPNAWLSVDAKGVVTIWVIRAEMGQGVLTAMPMLVAEQLHADWRRIRVERAVTDPRFGRMSTGGSTSVRRSWEPLQKAGAAAREMLVLAAARRWGVDPAGCAAKDGWVLDATGRRLGFGELAVEAARLPVPESPKLDDPRGFTLVGTRVPRVDGPEKVTGAAVFGYDVRLPGMLRAAVARCPVWKGRRAPSTRRAPSASRASGASSRSRAASP